MTLIQVAYDVPDDVLARLLSGELTRFGSVVRDSKEIILHLKEVALPRPDQAPDATGFAALKNPKVLIGLGVAVVVVATATGVAAWVKHKRRTAPERADAPATVDEYNASLAEYLEAIQKGRLSTETLDRLIGAIDALGQETESGNLSIEFAPEQADALVTLVADYSRNLAAANSVEVEEPRERPDARPVVVLRDWLEVQRDTIDRPA